MGRPAAAACIAAGALSVAMLVACSGVGRSPSAFCGRLAKEQTVLVAGVNDPAGVRAAVSSYRALDAVAPEAIRDEWHQVTELVQTAATIDPAKTDDSAALVGQAFASSPAAQKVIEYAKSTCGIDLGTAPTTAPPSTPPTAAATSPPSSG